MRVLDAVPRAITGLPRGVVRLHSADEAARRLWTGILTPSDLPDDLEWPPTDILVGAHESFAMMSRHRPDGSVWLIVAGAPARAGAIDPAILPAVTILQDTEMVLGDGRTITIQRLLDSDGAVWHQASWRSHARLLLVRSRGSLDDLLHIVQRVRERPYDAL